VEQALYLSIPRDSGDPAASDKGQYFDLNAFDLIAGVFYSGILWLNMAF
jgi:hypothetical protein